MGTPKTGGQRAGVSPPQKIIPEHWAKAEPNSKPRLCLLWLPAWALPGTSLPCPRSQHGRGRAPHLHILGNGELSTFLLFFLTLCMLGCVGPSSHFLPTTSSLLFKTNLMGNCHPPKWIQTYSFEDVGSHLTDAQLGWQFWNSSPPLSHRELPQGRAGPCPRPQHCPARGENLPLSFLPKKC